MFRHFQIRNIPLSAKWQNQVTVFLSFSLHRRNSVSVSSFEGDRLRHLDANPNCQQLISVIQPNGGNSCCFSDTWDTVLTPVEILFAAKKLDLKSFRRTEPSWQSRFADCRKYDIGEAHTVLSSRLVSILSEGIRSLCYFCSWNKPYSFSWCNGSARRNMKKICCILQYRFSSFNIYNNKLDSLFSI